jgi:Thiamine pyrophosphate enzyme, C-terminal TPP binding domain
MALRLPGKARFEIEMQWGSIGWAVPATFGYAVGASSRRTIALIRDGSFQLTAQEVAQMIRRKLPVIIFLINNHGYTMEVEIHDFSGRVWMICPVVGIPWLKSRSQITQNQSPTAPLDSIIASGADLGLQPDPSNGKRDQSWPPKPAELRTQIIRTP